MGLLSLTHVARPLRNPGRSNPVFVYKLIARGTLEEKIRDMQRRKGELANAVLEADVELASGISAAGLQAIVELSTLDELGLGRSGHRLILPVTLVQAVAPVRLGG